MTSTPRDQRTGSPAWSGLVYLCAAGVVWGTIGPAVDVVYDRSSLSVLTIGAYRAIAAVAALALAATVARLWSACLALLREHGWRVVLTGLLSSAFQLFFFVGVVANGVSVTTVVTLGFAPVLLLVVASARAGRPPSLGEGLTVGTAVLGLLLVSMTGSGDASATISGWGLLAALGAGTAYALAAELGGALTRRRTTRSP